MDDKLLNKKKLDRQNNRKNKQNQNKLKKNIPLQKKQSLVEPPKPISLQDCYIHRNTSVLGKPKIQSKICSCCGLKYQKQQIDSLFSPKDVYYLGSGFALYFTFIKICIVITVIAALGFSGATLYFNYITNSCITNTLPVCSDSFILKLSVANKLNSKKYIQLQGYLADGTIVIIFFLFQIARKWFRDIDEEAEAELDASDYAVMVCMPNNQFTKDDVIKSINSWWQVQYNKFRNQNKASYQPFKSFSQSFPIQRIIISYEMGFYNDLIEQLEDLNQQIQECQQQKKPIKPQITLRISQIKQIIKKKQFPKNKKCLLILSYPDQQDYILQKHQKTLSTTLFPFCYNLAKFNGQRIRISKPALPTQINWQNHQVKHGKKFITRIFVKIFCLAIIVAAEAGVYGLLRYWFQNKNTTTSTISAYISPMISVAINLINIILYKLLIYISKFQYRPTTLQQKVSITIKITISVFLNSGIMLLAAYFFLDMSSIWLQGGFVQTMTYSFLMSVIIPHITRFLNVDYILKFFQQSIIKCSSNQGKIQKQVNQIFQRPNVQVYEKYAWIINMVWWGSIFAPLIPISYPCVALSLFIHFWSQKFQHVVMIKQPKPFGNFLNRQMVGLLQMTPVFLAGGNLGMNIIIKQINKENLEFGPLFFDIIAVGVSLIIFIFPTQQLNRLISCIFCMQNTYETPNVEYKIAQKNFITTYQLQNPIYRQKAIERRQSRLNQNQNSQKNPLKLMAAEKHPIKQYNSKTRIPSDQSDRQISKQQNTKLMQTSQYPLTIEMQPVQTQNKQKSIKMSSENQIMQPPMNQMMQPPMNQMIQPPINQMQLINQMMQPPMNQMMQPPMNQMMQPPMNQMMSPPMNQMMQPPMNQMTQPPINQNQIIQPPVNKMMQTPPMGQNQMITPLYQNQMQPPINPTMPPPINQMMQPLPGLDQMINMQMMQQNNMNDQNMNRHSMGRNNENKVRKRKN